VDYNQEQFFHAQFDVPKMPVYMSYPMQNLYLTEMEYEKDMDRMKELYPKEVGRIVECVEDECDRMEYEGSLMFDEYPDRLMIEMVVDRIQKKVTGEDGGLEAEQFHGGEKEEAPTSKLCPMCKTEIAIDACRCPHCTSILDAVAMHEREAGLPRIRR
jgi:hypothetical protein